MNSPLHKDTCEQADRMYAHAMHALPPADSSAMEAHVAGCEQCQRELKKYRSIIASLVSWPSDVLRPSESLQTLHAPRIALATGEEPVMPAAREWFEPDWEQVAPGISCRLMATDTERNIISMLVRLTPGASYPPHIHAGVEELYLLDGELWIDDKKLYPGDYNRAEAPTGDQRVYSETGCTCVLITSTRDVLR